MKDIFEILKNSGIDVPADKHAEIRKMVSENYKTINEFNDKVSKLDGQIADANTTISGLKTQLDTFKDVDVKSLQDKIKEFEDAETARKQKEKAAEELEALKNRFAPLRGDKTFLNEGTENWIFSEFKSALTLEENKGKSDQDIYDAVIKDKNIYANPNKFEFPGVGSKGTETDLSKLDMKEYIAARKQMKG